VNRIFCFLLPLLVVAVCHTAHGGVIVSTASFNGTTYHLIAKDVSLTPQTWGEAEAFAVSLGGNLVSINSASENNFLFNNFGDSDPENFGVWIGLTDADSEGNFAWSSGDLLGYENWWPGQPDNSGNQDFVYMIDPDNPFFIGASGQWDDGKSPRAYGIAEITGVPEPSSIVFFLAAVSGLLRRRRTRTRTAG